jgi:hypothetical protein
LLESVANSGPLIALILLVIWLVLAAIFLFRDKIKSTPFGIVSSFFAPLILAFFLLNKISEWTSPYLGTIKTKAEQAQTLVNEIQSIKSTIESDERIIHAAAADARNAITLATELRAKNDEAAAQLQQVATQLEAAKKVTETLTTAVDFTTTVLAAESYERKAYDQLNTWAGDSSFQYAALASKAAQAIQANVEFLMLDYKLSWNQGVDPTKFGMDDLIRYYESPEFSTARPNVKIAMIQYIARRTDISEKQRLQFLLNIMQNASNLKVLAYAGNEFRTIIKLQYPATDVAAFREWLKNNEEKVP